MEREKMPERIWAWQNYRRHWTDQRSWQSQAVEYVRAEKESNLLEAVQRIVDWANAYPAESFPEQDLKRANEVLTAAGISMSAMHGQWARHLIGGIGKIASEAAHV